MSVKQTCDEQDFIWKLQEECLSWHGHRHAYVLPNVLTRELNVFDGSWLSDGMYILQGSSRIMRKDQVCNVCDDAQSWSTAGDGAAWLLLTHGFGNNSPIQTFSYGPEMWCKIYRLLHSLIAKLYLPMEESIYFPPCCSVNNIAIEKKLTCIIKKAHYRKSKMAE